mgnify:CR=1 FL=1
MTKPPKILFVCQECGGAPPDRTGQPRETVASGRVVDHSHCPICDFLAQTPIPAAPVAGPALAGAVCLAVPIHRVAPVDEIPATLWGRGPPSLA